MSRRSLLKSVGRRTCVRECLFLSHVWKYVGQPRILTSGMSVQREETVGLFASLQASSQYVSSSTLLRVDTHFSAVWGRRVPLYNRIARGTLRIS